MIELELDELARRIHYPPTPDLAPRVLERIRRRPRWRLLVAVAAALVAVAVAGLAASPGARSTVLDWLRIGGVEIRRTDGLPQVPLRFEPDFGEPVTLEEARRRADFPVLLPGRLAEPDAVYHREYPPGGTVTLVWGPAERPRLALSQWAGRVVEPVVIKLIPPGTRADVVTVGKGVGVWLHGAPHVLLVHPPGGGEAPVELALAGSVLVWELGDRSYRIEAAVSRDEALAIARSLR